MAKTTQVNNNYKQTGQRIENTDREIDIYSGLTSKQKLMDTLLYHDRCKENINIRKLVECSGMTRPTIEKIVSIFLNDGILALSEKIQNTQIYKFDINNKHARRRKAFVDAYLREEQAKLTTKQEEDLQLVDNVV